MNNCWSSVLLLMSCFLSGRFEHVDNVTDATLEILTNSFKKYIKSHSCVLCVEVAPVISLQMWMLATDLIQERYSSFA